MGNKKPFKCKIIFEKIYVFEICIISTRDVHYLMKYIKIEGTQLH